MVLTGKHKHHDQKMDTEQNMLQALWNLYFARMHHKQKQAQHDKRLSKIGKLYRHNRLSFCRRLQLQQISRKIRTKRDNQILQILLLPGRPLSYYIKGFRH